LDVGGDRAGAGSQLEGDLLSRSCSVSGPIHARAVLTRRSYGARSNGSRASTSPAGS
jgi:hypothetical protein